jgi:hypothetical protein
MIEMLKISFTFKRIIAALMVLALFVGLIAEKHGFFDSSISDFTLIKYYKIAIPFMVLFVSYWPQNKIKKKREMSFNKKRTIMFSFAAVIILLIGLEYWGVFIQNPLSISISRLIIGICAIGFLFVKPSFEEIQLDHLRRKKPLIKFKDKRSKVLFIVLIYSLVTLVLFMQNELDSILKVIIWIAIFGVSIFFTLRYFASFEKFSDGLKENNEFRRRR